MTYSAQIMRNLMLDLLDLAQHENGTLKLVSECFSIIKAVKRSFALVSHVAALKRVELKLDIQPKDRPVLSRIVGDERRFEQILVNLISNALKFSRKYSAVTVQLSLNEPNEPNRDEKASSLLSSSDRASHEVEFTIMVSDQGYGMSTEQVDNLFKNFATADDAN